MGEHGAHPGRDRDENQRVHEKQPAEHDVGQFAHGGRGLDELGGRLLRQQRQHADHTGQPHGQEAASKGGFERGIAPSARHR